MKKSHLAGYAVLTLCVLVPWAARSLTGPTRAAHTLEPAMVQAGAMLFHRDWTPDDPLCGGDGLGPVYNATSCVACHKQGGIGGSAGLEHNVTVFVRASRVGVLHAHAVGSPETLRDLDPKLPAISQPPLSLILAQNNGGPEAGDVPALLRNAFVELSQRNTPALFGARLIDEIPDSVIIAGERTQWLRWGGAPSSDEDHPAGRALRLADGRVGHFGWKAQSASLSDFVRAACAGELGLSNPGAAQPEHLARPRPPGKNLDLTAQQCDQITAFVAALPRPVERVAAGRVGEVAEGRRHFGDIGCADCHTPQLGSVAGIYSDLLLHRMGSDLQGLGSYNQGPVESPGSEPRPDEWRTAPLWGVADSGPWLHDGRAATLRQAIELHAGQAATAAARFRGLPRSEQDQLIAFLETLRAPEAVP